MDLEKLFNPQSIAIVGASHEEGTVGNVIAKNILSLGYSGKVFLINPKYDQILGINSYKSLAEITEEVDLAIIAIPAKFIIPEIGANAARVKNYVIISSGFSETNQEGKKREEELNQLAKDNGLNILGPNCLGFIIPALKLNASFAGGLPKPGNVAFISQSGALAVAMMDIFEKESIGFSHVVSVGNKMQLGETEMLEYLGHHPETKVVAMYLEGIKNGQQFMAAARQIATQKPIVVIKAGKTARTQKAIASHTGALAGESQITSAALKKAGIIEAANLEEFLNLISLISLSPVPLKNKVVVITNAGGAGVLTSDAFSRKSIELAELNEKIKDKLKKFLPAEASVENPIDVLGDAKEDRYKKTLAVFKDNSEVGSLLCLLTPQEQTPVNKIAAKLIQFKNKYNISVITSFIGGPRVKKAVEKLKINGIPNFPFPELAVAALDKYYTWSLYQNLEDTNNPSVDINYFKELIHISAAQKKKALSFMEAKNIFDRYKIGTPDTREIAPEELSADLSQNLKFPVVLKVDSDQVLHKTDQKGLILNIKDKEELGIAIAEMKKSFPGEKLIVQSMVAKGMELILGIKRDPIFGPVIVYGLGGIYTEVLKMVDFLIPPLGLEEIKKSLRESKIKFLFQKTRGQAPYNIDELADIIWKLSSLSQQVEDISEFDINPLIIYNDSSQAVAVDIKIII